MTRPKSYIICTSPRSGSTMLCKLLAATKVAGHPASLFHQPSIEAWLKDYALDATPYASRQAALAGILEAARVRGRGETDVFGLRLQRGSVAFFLDQLRILFPDRPSDVARIEDAFGPTIFIFLSRRDKLDQAISYIRAEQTGLWHRNADGTILERQGIRREDGFDLMAIRAQMAEFAGYDVAWRSWFDAQSIRPLDLSYEQLTQEPQRHLADILRALGEDSAIAQTIPVQTAKLADEISRAWRARFVSETA
ncbi:MAG: Stf0 family sulfotransferase [Pseudomonadota bacterium]